MLTKSPLIPLELSVAIALTQSLLFTTHVFVAPKYSSVCPSKYHMGHLKIV